MIRNTEKIFLDLVRSAIGTRAAVSPVQLSSSQWQRLSDLSVCQTLGTVVYEELSRLGHNMPSEIETAWKSFRDFHYAMFDAQLLALNHLSQILEERNMRLMALKGVSLALLYPNPQARECCDVDVYCFQDYDRVNEMLSEMGLISGLEHESDKHCSFKFDGVNVENHRYFSEYVNEANIVVGKKIEALSANEPYCDSRLPGILLPSPDMGLHFLMMHTLSHLAWSGITIRHLIDCGLYIKYFHSQVDWAEAFELWEKAGIAKAVKIIIELCRSELKMDIPGERYEVDENDKKFVFECTMNPFESPSATRNPFGKFYRKLRQFRVRKRMHPIVYGVPFPDPFLKSFSLAKALFKL